MNFFCNIPDCLDHADCDHFIRRDLLSQLDDFRQRLTVHFRGPQHFFNHQTLPSVILRLQHLDYISTIIRRIIHHQDFFELVYHTEDAHHSAPIVAAEGEDPFETFLRHWRLNFSDHTNFCHSCFLQMIVDSIAFTFDSPANFDLILPFLVEFARSFEHDFGNFQINRSFFSHHNLVSFEDVVIIDSRRSEYATTYDYVCRLGEVDFDPSFEEIDDYDPGYGSDDGALSFQSGIDKKFLVNLLETSFTSHKSKDCHKLFKILLNSHSRDIPDLSTRIRTLCYSHFKEKYQSRVMSSFHKSLSHFSHININNAKRFEASLFECLKFEGFIPSEINLKIDVPVIESLAEEIKRFAHRFHLDSTKCSLLFRTLWFFHDISRGDTLPYAAFRFITSGLDSYAVNQIIARSSGLFALISDHCKRIYDNKIKGGLSFQNFDTADVIPQLATFVFSLFSGKSDPDTEDRFKNAKLHEKAKLIRSNTTIAKYYVEIFTSILSLIRKVFTSEKDTLESMEVNTPQIVAWVKEVDALEKNASEGDVIAKARQDNEYALRIFELKKQADGWISSLARLHSTQPFWTMFMERYRSFIRIYNIVKINHANFKTRKAPFVMLFDGAPGVGKSFLITRLLTALYKIRSQPFDSAKDMYMRPLDGEYWDGYASQKVLYYNDIFQSADPQINRSVAMEMIQCAQTVPMPLNCARLEKKDTIFFNSEIVVADCNIFPTESKLRELVAEPDALRRRFSYRIKVNLLDQFSTNGKFDSDKTDKSFETEAYTFDVINSAITDKGPHVFGLSWKELISYLSVYAHKHRLIQDRNIESDDCGLTQADVAEIALKFESGSDLEDFDVEQLDPTTIPKPDYSYYGSLRERLSYSYTKFFSFFYQIYSFLFLSIMTSKKVFEFSNLVNKSIQKSRDFLFKYRKIFIFFSSISLASFLIYFIRKFFKKTTSEPVDFERVYPGDQRPRTKVKPRFTTNLESFSNIPSDLRLLDHHHQGLPEEGRVNHSHNCVQCGAEFSHAHKKRTYNESIVYVHLCSTCKKIDPATLKSEYSQFGENETAVTKLYSNQYNVVNTRTGNRLNGFFLKDHLFVIPNHFFFENLHLDSDTLMFSGVHRNFSIKVHELTEFRVDLSKDLRIISIPRSRVVSHKDITSFFLSSSTDFSCNGTLLVPTLLTRKPGEAINFIRHSLFDLTYRTELVWADDTEKELVDHIHNGIGYSSDTGPGDCGSLLVVRDRTNTPRILGMHMAGSYGTGVAGHLTHEAIERLVSALKPQICKTPDLRMPILDDAPTTTGPSIPLCTEDNIEIIGLLPPTHFIRPTGKSKVIPSVLHDTFETTSAPAMLKITKGIDPMRNGVKKMARPNVNLDSDILDIATGVVQSKLFSLKSEYKNKPRILTNAEAVNGVHFDPLIQPLNTKTSPGWPYKLSSKLPGKRDYILGEVPDMEMTKSFETIVDEYELSLKKGEPRDIYFFDSLKDERRPIEKALAGNTRVFSVGPLDFTLMMRKYTATFQAHCMANCTTSGSAVGINPHSTEWSQLYRRLRGVGGNFIAGDYGKWDKWVPYQLMMSVLKIVNNFYDDENGIVRECLFAQAFGAKRLAHRVVYQTSGGMPSGTPGTSIFNSLANEILFCYAFETLRRTHQPDLQLTHYHNLIGFTAYGDDHIVSVSDVLPWFNMITVSDLFKKMKIEYTSADKSTTNFTQKYVPLGELTYLKRNFKIVDDFFVLAPLDWKVICESILWSKAGEDPRKTILSTINSAMLEAVHHGRPAFDKLCNIISKQCRQYNLIMPIINYENVRRKIREEGLLLCDNVSLCDPMQILE